MSSSSIALNTIGVQDSTPFPIFPTASANSLSYAFLKRSENFHNKAEYKILDGGAYHHANTLNKTPKIGKPNVRREKKCWFEIESELVSSNEIDRQNAFIVLLGEIYRFEIGNTQPKYRIFELSPKKTYPISEGVSGYVEFFNYFFEHFCSSTGAVKSNFEEKDLFEGMGRVIFNKFLYYEDDFHFGNMCLNKDNYFVGIDHDNSLAPLLLQLKKKYVKQPQAKKEVQRAFPKSLIHFPSKSFVNKTDHIWRIHNKNVNDMGEPSVSDYDNLPLILHYLPAKWQFEWVNNYSEFLAKNNRFLNEKHFSLLKALVTSDIKHALIDIHIGHDKDREKTHELIMQRLIEMEDIAKKSTPFLNYVKACRFEAIKAIFYELAEFLNGNKHYRYATEKESEAQWMLICNKILTRFDLILEKLNLASLSSNEKCSLEDFYCRIHRQDQQVLGEIQIFYATQKMNYHASLIEKKRDERTLLNDSISSTECIAKKSYTDGKLIRLATTFSAFARVKSESKDEESSEKLDSFVL